MLATIVVPLDGSVLSDRALPFATRLVRATNGRLILVRAGLARKAWVLDEEVLTLLAETRRAAVEVAAVANRLRAEGIVVETCVRYDDAAGAITDVTHDRQADLIVMSMLGTSGVGRSVYGSVVEGILRQTEVPVLLVPTVCETTWPTSRVLRVLVPLDGSALAEAALHPALALTEALGGELLLVHMLPATAPAATASAARGYLDRVTTDIKHPAPAVSVSARVAERPTITAAAQEYGADVIAMTTRGKGLARRLAGATASDVLRRACVPVLAVGPGALAQESVSLRAEALACR